MENICMKLDHKEEEKDKIYVGLSIRNNEKKFYSDDSWHFYLRFNSVLEKFMC
jgi:hypothetical protein